MKIPNLDEDSLIYFVDESKGTVCCKIEPLSCSAFFHRIENRSHVDAIPNLYDFRCNLKEMYGLAKCHNDIFDINKGKRIAKMKLRIKLLNFIVSCCGHEYEEYQREMRNIEDLVVSIYEVKEHDERWLKDA